MLARIVRLVALTGLVVVAALAASSSPAAAATCDDYPNQAAAQQAADTRDADGDGIYCEALPCPCSNGSGGGSDDSGSVDTGAEERRREQARQREAARKRREAARKRREAARRRRAAARRRAAEHRERLARQRVERGQWRVSRVVDGDTLRVRRTDGSATETVNLVGVDAPEVETDDRYGDCGGTEATGLMLGLTFAAPTDTNSDGVLDAPGGLGALVDLTTDRSQDLRDDAGRLLAYVDVVDDAPPTVSETPADVGEQLVNAGYSEAVVSGRRFARYGRYHAAELRASEAPRGVWATCDGDFHATVEG